jgi:hypothetical protein
MVFRALVAALLVFLTLCNAETLRQPVRSRELGLADLPPCGVSRTLRMFTAVTHTRQIQCMIVALPASGCSLTDATCVCSNQKLAKTLGACMLANCTMADALNTSRVQADLCHFPKESKRAEFYWYTGKVFNVRTARETYTDCLCTPLGVTYVIATLFATTRFAGKLTSKRVGWDDALVGAVILLLAILMGLFCYLISIGFGDHLWDLEHGRLARY